jgi:hypothetical protein
MTKDQKQVLKALGIFVGFKAALYAAIVYSSRTYRKMMELS